MKKLKFLSYGLAMTAALSIGLTGCGGGDGGSNPSITDKNYIVIMHDVISGVCETTLFKDLLVDNGFVNPLSIEEDNSVSCSTYGRDSNTCYEDSIVNYTDDPNIIGDIACVVGFDDFIQVAKVSYKSTDIDYQEAEIKPSLLEATDSIQTSFTQIAN